MTRIQRRFMPARRACREKTGPRRGPGEGDISGWHRRLCWTLALALAWSALATARAWAQPVDDPAVAPADTAAAAADTDPPARAGRLSYLEGAVSLQPAGVDDWNAALLNRPLTAGDALWTDTGSRAEVDLGPATVRLDERTSFVISDLGDRAVQLQIDGGSIEITLDEPSGLEAFEVDAPNAALLLTQPGEYRLSVDNSGMTTVSVRAGRAAVQTGEQQNMTLSTGERGVYAAGGSYAVAQAGAPDEFDQWCQQRQARWLDAQAATQYVSSDAVGYEDLNDYGQWQPTPDYGYVWTPTQVPDDWAPYTTGSWAWVAPWGWNWIDTAPWGYAPFHYGRWMHIGRHWCWIPAPPGRHVPYAPALVAWVGGPGAGGAMALGGGSAVGWLPLGPGEVYVPAYRVTPRYFQAINLGDSSRLTPGYVTSIWNNPGAQNRYINRNVPGALTVIPQSSFTGGESVARHRIEPPAPFQTATAAARAPGIAPERASLVGALSLSHVAMPPAHLGDQAIVSRRQPPQPAPSFARQLPAITANGGRPLDVAQLRALRSPPPIRRVVPPAPPLVHRPSGSSGGAGSNPPHASTATPGSGSTGLRGIPERAPSFQPVQPPPTTDVFRQRDREILQEHQMQQRDEQAQEAQLQQRLQQQRQAEQHARNPAQPPAPPQHPAIQAPPAPTPTPPTPHTEIRRPPPPSNVEQR
jgi:hypothetical protein